MAKARGHESLRVGRRSRLLAGLLLLGLVGATSDVAPAQAANTVTIGPFSVIPDTLLPFYLTPFGNQLVFTTDYNRVMITGGATAHTLRDSRPLSCGSPGPHDLTRFKSSILFGGGQTDDELWRTNGTAAGTQLGVDVWHGARSSDPYQLIATSTAPNPGSRTARKRAPGS